MRDSLIGTWRLVSYEALGAHGKITRPLGKNLMGFLCYTEEGFMSVQIMRKNRPKHSFADLALSSMEGMADTSEVYAAYAGRFSIDEAASTVTHHVELSLLPAWVNTDQIRSVAFRAGRLYLSGGTLVLNGKLQEPHTAWEKPPSQSNVAKANGARALRKPSG